MSKAARVGRSLIEEIDGIAKTIEERICAG
jgi:hypothetical protein